MRTLVAAVVFIAMACAVGAAPLDFVVLLDVSSSMLPFFDETVNFLIRDIVGEHLRIGDRFHLLSFADVPEVELTLTINDPDEIDEIINRILLLQPLGRYTDLVSALRFLYTYSSQTPVNSDKKILVLTDGIHDPPPGSRYSPERDAAIDEVVSTIARDIRREGWGMSIVEFPDDSPPVVATIDSFDPGVSDGRSDESGATGISRIDVPPSFSPAVSDTAPNLLRELSSSLGVNVVGYEGATDELSHLASGAPRIDFPADLGKVRRRFSIPLVIENVGTQPAMVKLTGLVWNSIDILTAGRNETIAPGRRSVLRAPVKLPESLPLGAHALEVELEFSDDLRAYPRAGLVMIDLVGSGIDGDRLVRVLAYVGLGLLAAAILAALVFFFRTVLTQTVTATASAPAVKYREIGPGERAVEMMVEGQTRNIGTRNVQVIPDGDRRSIGSGGSAFLIFAFPVRHRVAELMREGDRYSFVPVNVQYCESGEVIDDCLDRPIVIKSITGRDISIVFRRYISPLERINRIMHLTDSPGLAPSE